MLKFQIKTQFHKDLEIFSEFLKQENEKRFI
jgi:hypothetical protein